MKRESVAAVVLAAWVNANAITGAIAVDIGTLRKVLQKAQNWQRVAGQDGMNDVQFIISDLDARGFFPQISEDDDG